MKSLLWVLAISGGLNTILIMWLLFSDAPLPQVTRLSRLFDALVTFGLMVWAIVLLAR